MIYGDVEHYIDHMAPLCALLNIPLVTNELRIRDIISKFYPAVTVFYWDYLNFPWQLVKNFDVVFYCSLRGDFKSEFQLQQDILQKEVKTIWCPHGNSDKGRHQYFMEALQEEIAVLLYGRKMFDYIIDKGVSPKNFHFLGNYRYYYYLQCKSFYDGQIKEILGEKKKTTILYAPTWHDCENSCSFNEVKSYLLNHVPHDMRLIVKLHPNTFSQYWLETEQLLEEYKNNNDIVFLKDFPCIYPLLDYVDVYLGDMSSVGYDFLIFNRPMFFLNKNLRNKNQDLGLYLYSCGEEILPTRYERIYEIIRTYLEKKRKKHVAFQKKTYEYTFGSFWNIKKFQDDILQLVDKIVSS